MDIGIDLGTTFSVLAVRGQVVLAAGYPLGVYLPDCDVTIIPTPEGMARFPSTLRWDPAAPDESREVATRSLTHLKTCAERAMGGPVQRAVVTHPAYFSASQKQATLEAAEAAGFAMSPGQLLMEPSAVALAHAQGAGDEPGRVMVYDLRDSSFDATVLTPRDGTLDVVSFGGGPVLFDGAFTRDPVSGPISDTLQETIDHCRSALARAEIAPEDLDLILLAGDSAHRPGVRECLSAAFPRPRIVELSHPALSVAAGAAITGATLPPAAEPEMIPTLSYSLDPAWEEIIARAPSQSDALASLDNLLSSVEWPAATVHDQHISKLRPDLDALADDPSARLGPFSIQRLLGHGAFSKVYLAIDVTSSIKRAVALKIPLSTGRAAAPAPGFVSTPERAPAFDRDARLEALRQEALLWQSLSLIGHPNILQFEDLKHIGDTIFFVMEYMSGGNLESALSGMTGKRRIEAIIQSLEPICAGLAFAHARGVIHGDVKPQNILVQRGQVKLADFGASFTVDTGEGPAAHRTMGTMMFLPPESFDGVRTPSMDVYALGVTLYYLLTSEYPFHRFVSDLKELTAAKLSFRPSVQARCPAVPAWLDEIIQRCMSPRPEDRFRDGQDLLDQVRFNHVILAAHWNVDSRTAVYDLDVQGIRAKELLHHQIGDGNIDGLCAAWDRLGELALERAGADAPRQAEVDALIRTLLEHVSELGPRFVLDARMPAALSGARIASLWVRCDPRLMALPWELFKIGATYASLEFPVARWPMMIDSPPTPARRPRGRTLRMLIIVDPSGDLTGARDEYRDLTQELGRSSRSELMITTSDASDTAFELRAKMVACDIIHFIGHAFCVDDHGDLTRSGWLLKSGRGDDEILKPTDLQELWNGNGPSLVFANGCTSARSSAATVRTALKTDAALAMASAFLSTGVANYIGAAWEVPDTIPATRRLAVDFYHDLLEGASIGNALHSARVRCSKEFGLEELTWARYVHCGDPSTRLFSPRA